MIDPRDNLTATIPGIPEVPPPEPRTTQAERREQMVYHGPRERSDRCGSCRYACIVIRNPDRYDEYEDLRCSVGDFPVQRGGICNEWASAT